MHHAREGKFMYKLSFVVVYLKSGPGVNAELVTQDEK